jgi:DnaJ-class molecular chaperone
MGLAQHCDTCNDVHWFIVYKTKAQCRECRGYIKLKTRREATIEVMANTEMTLLLI